MDLIKIHSNKVNKMSSHLMNLVGSILKICFTK